MEVQKITNISFKKNNYLSESRRLVHNSENDYFSKNANVTDDLIHRLQKLRGKKENENDYKEPTNRNE